MLLTKDTFIYQFQFPVIGIGNLAVGGTGKHRTLSF